MEKNRINRKTIDITGFSRFSPIILRGHSFAARWLENGIDMRVMQKYLGHASIKETADTYTYVLPDMKANEMLKMENTVSY